MHPVDAKNILGILLTDLPKSFCLPNDLIIAKLNVYEFILPALNMILNYLANIKQSTKINDSYPTWSDILFPNVPSLHHSSLIYF